jgi:hypothetical protein
MRLKTGPAQLKMRAAQHPVARRARLGSSSTQCRRASAVGGSARQLGRSICWRLRTATRAAHSNLLRQPLTRLPIRPCRRCPPTSIESVDHIQQQTASARRIKRQNRQGGFENPSSFFLPLPLSRAAATAAAAALLHTRHGHRRLLGMKVVWIISASDPIRIRITRIWRRVFDIHADVDNPNPIVCGCRCGFGVSDIRRIWIIR